MFISKLIGFIFACCIFIAYGSSHSGYLQGIQRHPDSSIASVFYGEQERNRGRLIADKVAAAYGDSMELAGVSRVYIYAKADFAGHDAGFCVMSKIESCVGIFGVTPETLKVFQELYLERDDDGWHFGIPEKFVRGTTLTPVELESLVLDALGGLAIKLDEENSKRRLRHKAMKTALEAWDGYPPPSN